MTETRRNAEKHEREAWTIRKRRRTDQGRKCLNLHRERPNIPLIVCAGARISPCCVDCLYRRALVGSSCGVSLLRGNGVVDVLVSGLSAKVPLGWIRLQYRTSGVPYLQYHSLFGCITLPCRVPAAFLICVRDLRAEWPMYM
jgi:hypothetical protein